MSRQTFFTDCFLIVILRQPGSSSLLGQITWQVISVFQSASSPIRFWVLLLTVSANGLNKLLNYSACLQKEFPGLKTVVIRIHQWRDQHRSCLGIWYNNENQLFVDRLHLCFNFKFLLGQFSGLPFQIVPVTFWPIYQCFTLDEGVCLWGKGLCCPGRGGEEVVGVLLPICQCTHTVIGANRPEESSPAGPRGGRGLQSHRLWGNNKCHLTHLATMKLIASVSSYRATFCG